MIRLVYASTALSDWSLQQLLQLLKTCRKNNSANDITGMLLYSNRTFFQVLEGEEEKVMELYNFIKKDKRHRDVTLIEKKDIIDREFPFWSMGSQKLDKQDLGKIEGLDGFVDKDFNPAGFLAHKGVVAPLMKLLRGKLEEQVGEAHEELPFQHEDPFIQWLNRTIRLGVKFLALLMVIVIISGLFDVLYILYEKFKSPPYFLLTIEDMPATFGAFLSILIAIEIFLNITLYIRSDVIPVKLVVATALMAICRKVIVFDFKHLPPEYVTASSWVVIALGVTYWLIEKKD